MLAYSVIEKKQHGGILNADELNFMVKGFLDGSIPPYQMSALLMAVYFKGMNAAEVKNLIQIIIDSGDRVTFGNTGYYYSDKHSTGGVGDKVSIILAPLVAATGDVRVPMISGRGLGHSGGTLDKLESISGFNTRLSAAEFIRQTDAIGCSLIGQTGQICPADKELYALRDVTATVRSIPLICTSILSKKIAEGIQGLVLDVKTGNGAFMQTYEDSYELAAKLKEYGEFFGLSVRPLITDMSQPLGNKIGNWLEIEESLDLLHNGGPADLREVTLALSAEMVKLARPHQPVDAIRKELESYLANGKAFEKFLEITAFQKGDISVLEHPETYPQAKHILTVSSSQSGYVTSVDTYQLGLDAITLGAGRQRSSDIIDPVAGMEIHISIGDNIEKGTPVFTLYSNRTNEVEELARTIESRIGISPDKVNSPQLIHYFD